MRLKSIIVLFIIALFLGVLPSNQTGFLHLLSAQENGEAVPTQSAPTVSVESIDSDLASLEANSQLSDDQKAASKDILLRAKQALQAAKNEQDLAKQYEDSIASVAQRTSELQKKVDAQDLSPPEISADATVQSLSQQLASAQAEQQVQQAKSTELEGEPGRRRSRLTEIPVLVAKAEQDLTDVKNQMSQSADNESPAETGIRETLQKAKSAQLRSEIDRLNKEEAAYLATSDLLPLQKKSVEQSVERLKLETKTYQEALIQLQSKKTRDSTKVLEQTTSAVPESLKGLAQENLTLVKTQSRLISESTKAQNTLTEVRAALEEVKSELKTSETRIKNIGLTDALGLMFRERRQDFEEMRLKYAPTADLRKKIEQSQIDAFRLEDELNDLKRELGGIQSPDITWDSDDISWNKLSEPDAKWVLQKKRQKLIEETLQSSNQVLETMVSSDTQRRQLAKEIERFTDFADTRLFWTRSDPAVSLTEIESAPAILAWLADVGNWRSAGLRIWETIRFKPLRCLVVVIAILGLFYMRPPLRRIIVNEGKKAHYFNSTFRRTLYTLGATFAYSAATPVFFLGLSYLLLGTTGTPFTHGLGYGFAFLALFSASRLFLKDACRNDGLADAHFGWNDNIRIYLRRHLQWYILLGGISIFILVLCHDHPQILARTFATRVNSTLLFIITAAFHHVMLCKRSPLYTELHKSNPNSIVLKWQKVIWAVAVLLPLSLGVMSMAGYLNTTFRFGRSLQSTFMLLVLVVVLLGLLSRWLTLHHRDATRQNLSEQRKRRLSLNDKSNVANVANEAGIVIEDETKMDLPKLDYQARQTAMVLASLLAITGLVYIWSDVLPALAYLDEIKVWSVGVGENVESVTLEDLIYVVFSIAAVWFAVRNIPSMLELVVLSRTSLDGGAKYAIVTLLRYALFVVGAIVILNLLAIPYDQLGWLIAGASVGLGFGLQEIVANFVCGIILLLERPVRVGDVVTIDDTTGVVSKIQMRATTVTNWDRKELVVPNKDLITQKLLNWSLSNVVNRMTIEVGVAYGSDPDKVRGILQEAVAGNPDVMKDPPPMVNFDTFGDSSINFNVRFFLPKLDNRIEVTHRVNTSIAQALEEAGISVPFPQRDVHFVEPNKGAPPPPTQ